MPAPALAGLLQVTGTWPKAPKHAERREGVNVFETTRIVVCTLIAATTVGCSTSTADRITGATAGGSGGLGAFTGGVDGRGGSGGAGGCSCPALTGQVGEALTLSLECYCQLYPCPASYEAYIEGIVASCPYARPEVTSGCGVKMVRWGSLGGGTGYFDSESGALLGISSYDDVPHGACQSWAVGTTFDWQCDNVEVCNPCPDADADAGVPPCE